MKKKLNILCVLLLVLMIASFVMSCLAGAEDFAKGWHEGANHHEPMGAYGILCMFTLLIGFFVGLYAIACFIRFILCVNQGEVFTWDNVSLLRIAGWCSIIVPTVLAAVMTPETDNLIETWGSCITIAAEGIFILIMAEAFAIGLKLKEEQDLTI